MLEINIRITAEDNGAFSDREAAVIAALNGSAPAAAAAATTKATEPAPAKAAAPAPAKDAEAPAEAPKRRRRTRAEIEADEAAAKAAKAAKEEPADEPDEEDQPTLQEELAADDEQGTDETPAELRERVIKTATKLISGGNAKEVRAALTDLGAKKVADLKDKDLAAFMAALEAVATDA